MFVFQREHIHESTTQLTSYRRRRPLRFPIAFPSYSHICCSLLLCTKQGRSHWSSHGTSVSCLRTFTLSSRGILYRYNENSAGMYRQFAFRKRKRLSLANGANERMWPPHNHYRLMNYQPPVINKSHFVC